MELTYQFFSYKLWHKLIDLKLRKKDLQTKASLSPSVIDKMGRGESVNLETLAKIWLVLHCGLSDIVDIILKEG